MTARSSFPRRAAGGFTALLLLALVVCAPVGAVAMPASPCGGMAGGATLDAPSCCDGSAEPLDCCVVGSSEPEPMAIAPSAGRFEPPRMTPAVLGAPSAVAVQPVADAAGRPPSGAPLQASATALYRLHGALLI